MPKPVRRIFKCKRCEYEWMSRFEHPNYCAGCRDPYWNMERSSQRPHPTELVSQLRGSPRKYAWHDLEVGQEIKIPFFWDHKANYSDTEANGRMYRSLKQWEKRTGRLHDWRAIGATFYCKRIK